MTNLDIAKSVIGVSIEQASCGIFNSRNKCGDPMVNLYADENLRIDICYHYEYFEVFGLSKDEFHELYLYYKELVPSYQY